ncbi:MAG TPA: sigma 54-interacting transcriptional regulator [Terriglobales bacterium]|nr:sigma 54-interacting transcriptional regulator [Terriglobales bacterium]
MSDNAAHLSDPEPDGILSRVPYARTLSDELADELGRYRQLLDCVQAIVWRGNAQTFQFTFVSPYAETLLGYPVQRWLRDPAFWREHIHPEDRDWAVHFCAKATREKKSHEFDYRMMAADGKVVWLHGVVHVLVEDGQASELIGIMIDITEKKQAEEALRRGEDRLRKVVDVIPQQIWSCAPDGTLDFCNERWRSELGLTLEEGQGDGWQTILHPDDRQRVLTDWHESVTNGTPYEQEERHRMRDGQYRWFLSRGVPLRDSERQIVRWYGTNTDIDDQKRAREALQKSERRWRGVFDNSKIGVALQDSSLRYVDANAAFCQIVGYRLDELQKMTCLDITYEEDRERYKAIIKELTSGKRNHFDLEKRYRRRDGELVWSRINGSSVGTADSPLWVVMAEDITKRKRLADELHHERDRLQLLLDLNHRFISKLDVREFFHALMDGIRLMAGWQWASILLPEPSSDRLSVYLSSDNSYLREGYTLPIDGSLQGKVYRSAKPVAFRIEDLPGLCPVYRDNDWMQQITNAEHVRAGCALPLIHEGRVIGVLFLMTRVALDPVKSDLNFLQELASLVTATLHNSLRFESVNESRAKLLTEREYIESDFLRERGIADIIGDSPGIIEVLKQVRAVAPTDSTVLITGETGTGKELIARAIHGRSPRHDHSFIKVDCAAIPASLLESELFGHEKGAFTGATTQKPGRFELADHGTLFLDEVGDIPLELQPKLLRVLQDHAFERVGSNRLRQVDVRIIAATNRNLETMVETGKFREDLYYRLRVFPIVIPPLRERAEDIPALVRHYVENYARRMRKPVTEIPAEAMETFVRYPWPGNVRELQHFIERAVILSPGHTLDAPLAELTATIQRIQAAYEKPSRHGTLREIEREAILQALLESNWVVGGPHGAAAKLGLRRTTLSSRMEKLGISRPRR